MLKQLTPGLAISAMVLLTPAPSVIAAEVAAVKLPLPEISETLTVPRKNVDVLGSTMSYLELGEGDPVLFIHGNPTSAYLWRNIMPYVANTNRAIAIDLIGMGRSGKPDIGYTFADHYNYLEAFIDTLGLEELTLVTHDWGAALGWDYARRNPDKVVRLAFMEGVLPSAFPRPTFESMGEEMGNMFRAFKDKEQGHKLVIEDNMFVEQVLPGFVNRALGDRARAEYGAPYLKAADRKPTLVWPREVPIEGKPAANVNTLEAIAAFMETTGMPVLLTYAEPGVETAFIAQGLHFIQEDQPDAIGRAISDWMRRN